jgi:hypothetical protein
MASDEIENELIQESLHFLRDRKLNNVLSIGVHELFDSLVGDLLPKIYSLDEFLFVYQQHFISVINNRALSR